MEFPSPAARIGVDLRGSTSSTEAELARLRAQVAWLRAERAALWWAVGHDDLTGLANRRLFATLAPSLLQIGRPTAVIVLDLNGFKPVNDTLGHEAGDLVLRIVGNRLASCAGTDVVARLGGDEFSCVLTSPHRAAPDNWWRPSVTALSAAIAEPMLVDGHLVHVTASIGVAPACGGVLLDELLRRADLAMYHAKATGDRYAAWEWGGPTWAAPRAGGHRADAPDGEGPGGPVPVAGTAPKRATTPWQSPPSRASRTVEIVLVQVGRDRALDAATAVPTCEPAQRDPADVAPADTYRPHDPVWVYRQQAWRPGVVESASSRAVTATYRYAGGAGTVVDTMAAEYVVARAAADPQLDRRHLLWHRPAALRG